MLGFDRRTFADLDDMTIYLLYKDGMDWHERYVLAWSKDKAALEAEALRREWADYEIDVENIAKIPEPILAGRALSPDETTYRNYFVEAVEEL